MSEVGRRMLNCMHDGPRSLSSAAAAAAAGVTAAAGVAGKARVELTPAARPPARTQDSTVTTVDRRKSGTLSAADATKTTTCAATVRRTRISAPASEPASQSSVYRSVTLRNISDTTYLKQH